MLLIGALGRLEGQGLGIGGTKGRTVLPKPSSNLDNLCCTQGQGLNDGLVFLWDLDKAVIALWPLSLGSVVGVAPDSESLGGTPG